MVKLSDKHDKIFMRLLYSTRGKYLYFFHYRIICGYVQFDGHESRNGHRDRWEYKTWRHSIGKNTNNQTDYCLIETGERIQSHPHHPSIPKMSLKQCKEKFFSDLRSQYKHETIIQYFVD